MLTRLKVSGFKNLIDVKDIHPLIPGFANDWYE
jgi:hypothetical protein